MRPSWQRASERGAQTVEWLGVGAVVVALVAAVGVAVPDASGSVPDAITSLICRAIGQGCEDGGGDGQAAGALGDGQGEDPGGQGDGGGGGDDDGDDGGGGLLDGVGAFFGGAADVLGDAASWGWDQFTGYYKGFWEGLKGMGEGLWLMHELSISRALYDFDGWVQSWEEMGQAAQFARENPGEFGKALINWEDLAEGRYGEWLGNLGPDAILTAATMGTGSAAVAAGRATRAADAMNDLADAARTADRLTPGGRGGPDAPGNRPDGQNGDRGPDCPTSWSAGAPGAAPLGLAPANGPTLAAPATGSGVTPPAVLVQEGCGDGNDAPDGDDAPDQDNPAAPNPSDAVRDSLRDPDRYVDHDTTPEAFLDDLGGVPDGWRQTSLGQGTHRGQGWKLEEVTPDGNPTGRHIRFHPGGGRHGPEPYWTFTSGEHGKIQITGPNFRP